MKGHKICGQKIGGEKIVIYCSLPGFMSKPFIFKILFDRRFIRSICSPSNKSHNLLILDVNKRKFVAELLYRLMETFLNPQFFRLF
jgi:hypothetical protein